MAAMEATIIVRLDASVREALERTAAANPMPPLRT